MCTHNPAVIIISACSKFLSVSACFNRTNTRRWKNEYLIRKPHYSNPWAQKSRVHVIVIRWIKFQYVQSFCVCCWIILFYQSLKTFSVTLLYQYSAKLWFHCSVSHWFTTVISVFPHTWFIPIIWWPNQLTLDRLPHLLFWPRYLKLVLLLLVYWVNTIV